MTPPGRRPGAAQLLTSVTALSRAATSESTAEDLLRSLCTIAAQALDVHGAGVMIRLAHRTRFVHSTTERVRPLGLLQEFLQAGPCADSLLTLEPVAVDDLALSPRWPQFNDMAADLGLGAVLAVPLLGRGHGWGVLDLYRERAGPWTTAEVEAAEALAAVAASYVVMAQDREDAHAAYEALAHRATHDGLTGLPNRGLLFDRLEHALLSAHRRGTAVGVVFFDLDLFKAINDTFGHAAGDQVLVEVAARLTSALRGDDTLARFAGDEFVLVCEGLPAEPTSALVSRLDVLTARLREALSVPVRIGPVDLVVTASIGVAITTDLLDPHDLIAEADTAMYAAKGQGGGQVAVRDHTGASAVRYALKLKRELTRAFTADQLRVHYQPIVSAVDREVRAVEALLRWQQPDGSVLSAAEFIDVAVATGLIISIGRWVIDQTCAQLAHWQRELGDQAPRVAFVNLSARELGDPLLLATIETALDVHGLTTGQLGLEIVEDDLAAGPISDRLQELHRLGHPLSIDDFGTGYSSIARLIDLPVDYAKIDLAFVAGLPDDRRRARLVSGILTMTADLDLEVIAEGVETAAQASCLTRAGCHLLQGHHLGRPSADAGLPAG